MSMVRIEHIEDCVCARLMVGQAELHTSHRRPAFIARAVAMASARELLGWSLHELADYFGMKSHAAAYHAIAVARDHPVVREVVNKMKGATQ